MVYNFNITKGRAFRNGFKDGIPIGLGYFAVSFSLGILAKKAGLSPLQGFLASLLNNASAGEYAVFTLIAAGASYVEVAIMTFVANARYLLMSTALSQKISPDLPLAHRLLIAFDVTDELFAISIKQEGYLNPFYSYGAYVIALFGWSVGTAFGVIAGNLMPLRLVSAFSVALYGMFLACIIPAARSNRVVLIFIFISFVASYLATCLPFISSLSSGTRTIILTVIIASLAAFVFPRKEEADES